MRTEVDSFRKLNLYKQALRFTHLVLQWTEQNKEAIGLKECLEIRKLSTKLPSYIAKAAVEINVKHKYKKLNRGKEALQKLVSVLRHHGMDKHEKRMVPLSIELQKLFNGYFGLLNRKKNANKTCKVKH